MNILKNIRTLIISILIFSAPIYGFMLLYLSSDPSMYAYGFIMGLVTLIGGIILSYKRVAGWYLMMIGIILIVPCWQLDAKLQQEKTIASEKVLCEKLKNDPTCTFDTNGGYKCKDGGSTYSPCHSIK